jgi:hypothetical protein
MQWQVGERHWLIARRQWLFGERRAEGGGRKGRVWEDESVGIWEYGKSEIRSQRSEVGGRRAINSAAPEGFRD